MENKDEVRNVMEDIEEVEEEGEVAVLQMLFTWGLLLEHFKDKLEQQHSLFTRYKDPCRLGPGEEKPWAIGTLLDPEGLYDDEVCTPDNLQKVLENEEGRKRYLVYPTSKNHSSSQKGRKSSLKGNGRRIDYMLYTEEGLYLEWKVDVEEFSFITQLAGLTDHLPVAMRLMVSTGEDDP
ncbi:PREDICTED: sphingomyelin phosphodiesterase 3-like [Crocodylus porosus]|uniref:sphingomyelin phosphodiesterase 3-like n=1 Tax=Crocodylus porosus TaxID=8502 RepID=UPI0009400A48|nr:PREDICTED: sphingomyelin phosphodiesterase 3-like [Crocodylus porosus]